MPTEKLKSSKGKEKVVKEEEDPMKAEQAAEDEEDDEGDEEESSSSGEIFSDIELLNENPSEDSLTDTQSESVELTDSEVHEDDDYGESMAESDSSEDEVAAHNTVGNVPFEWYKDEEHIGYDIAGKKIKKKVREDKLDSFLASADNSENWRKIYDEYNDEIVELTKEETRMIRRVLKGMAPHPEFDPYPTAVDWVTIDKAEHPFPDAPEPKRRFVPSKWESKMIVRLVRGIRKGLIKVDDKPKEENRVYLLWGDDRNLTERHHIPPPKPKLPGHEESYNPSLEYIPTAEEVKKYELMYEEDRPKFIPKRFTSMRSVPAYDKAVRESFDRCLDLYLCPRTQKKRINIDPESLKPKLPSRKDLKPYPTTCYLEYKGHKGPVVSISTDSTGQWIASGSNDGTVRVWEVESGRCFRVWELGEAVQHVAWNPSPELPVLAVSVGQDVFLLNTGLGNDEENRRVDDLLHVESHMAHNEPGASEAIISETIVKWSRDDNHGAIRLNHYKTVSSVEWHRKGDYFSTLMPYGESKAVLVHQLSKGLTQRIPFKLHGLPVSTAFHPTRSIFFISTKKNVRIYDLLKQRLIKKLETGVREVSSIAIHPGGDNVIVGSKDGKLCWFDMDLSSQPYRVLNCHPKDITRVAFHRSYPLFASSSDDCTAYVFHGMVYSDLNQNPLIVPLEILRGHASVNGRGVLDCKFHPRQPWLFTAGADSVIKLYCH
nr:ribosome biogenesis protein BOP1 homolog isoform X2 [Coffea arabica]